MPPSTPTLKTPALRVLAWATGAAGLWLILCFQLFVDVDQPGTHRTDAVIMLGGASSERLPAAQRVQSELNIPVLVLSRTDTSGNRTADEACTAAMSPNASLVCFRPENLDTRGEARTISRLVEANRWKSVTVVTSGYHVIRAALLIRQCTTADVQMVASHPDLNPGQWLRRFVIETAGLIDVALRPECAPR